MRGRKPKPTKLKLIRGNPGKRSNKRDEPNPTDEMPACPDYLDATARREWRRITKTLAGTGLVTVAEMPLLAIYCCAYSTWYEAIKKLNEHGKVVRDAKGDPKPSPWLRISNQASDQIFKLSGELGFSPMARLRLTGSAGLPNVAPETDNDFRDL